VHQAPPCATEDSASEPAGATTPRGILRDAMKKLLAYAFLLFLCVTAVAQTGPDESKKAEIRKMLSEFVIAFDNLDWEKFRAAFADDATVFYPREFPRRAAGRAEFEKTFKLVFEQIRAGRPIGPFMDIQPREMEIQIAGEVAIATFHLDDKPGLVNRRTMVLRKTPTGWKIIHLHASEVRIDAKP
jgi:ketosteroid isomerase-like protein